jgi:hypothetical protein
MKKRTRAPTMPNKLVNQNAMIHQFSQNSATAAASAMNESAAPHFRSLRHSGCQSRNRPRCASSSGCTHALREQHQASKPSITSSSQRPACKRFFKK